nr:spore proteinase gpr (EC 3.4.-.-) - Bacillus megaterium (fragments) [Priestia megaterium]
MEKELDLAVEAKD